MCKSVKQLPSRPGPEYKLGILLPCEGIRGKLVWIKCTLERDPDDQVSFENPETDVLLGGDGSFPDSRRISRNVGRNIDLDHTLTLYFRDRFLFDGSLPNQTIRAISGGGIVHDFGGPHVIMRQPHSRLPWVSSLDYLTYEDITLADYRIAADYFRLYGNLEEGIHELDNNETPPSDHLCGVIVTCEEDRKLFGKPEFIPVSIEPHALVLTVLDVSYPSIPRLIGIPLRTLMLDRQGLNDPTKKKGSRHDAQTPSTNPTAVHLHKLTDIHDDWFGFADKKWMFDVPNVLVLPREKNSVITPQLIEVICRYSYDLTRLLEDANGAGLVQRTRKEVVNMITAEHFKEYFEKYERAKARREADERVGEDHDQERVEQEVP